MNYFKVSSPNEVSQQLASLISLQLKTGQNVLWLVSGGSSIPIAVNAASELSKVSSGSLAVILVDDVYGARAGTSNWDILQAAGFSIKGAKAEPIISQASGLTEASQAFNERLQQHLNWADFSIGQFGIGEGYHTGGIQPNSIAAKTHDKLAIGYVHNGLSRVTVTPGLIAKLDTVFINSLGESKRPLVQHFLNSKADITKEPTQALKTAKQVYLASDVID